jgi:quercetin dioxygenase-like cupin family protein
MLLKRHIPGIVVAILCGAVSTATLAQSAGPTVQAGVREVLLQTTQSWNGKPYTHYPKGKTQLTTIKVTLAPHTALPWHTHPFPKKPEY